MSIRNNMPTGYIANEKDSSNRIIHELRNIIRALQGGLTVTVGPVTVASPIYETGAGPVTADSLNVTMESGQFATLSALGTEATLLSILTALQNGREFEQNLVIDGNDDTFLQVRIFNSDTGTFDPPIYYDASGVASTPLAPITLVNPTFYLANMNGTLSNLYTFISSRAMDTGATSAQTPRVVLESGQGLSLTNTETNTGGIYTEAVLARIDYWDKIIGNSKVFTWVAGALGQVVQKIEFYNGLTLVMTQTFTYDSNDNVTSITAS